MPLQGSQLDIEALTISYMLPSMGKTLQVLREKNALSLAGTVLGYYPLRVLSSKIAIAPFQNERKMCARAIYCTNIDRNVTQMIESASQTSIG
ncbi:polyadenylate-binding protein-interacting protein 8-like [Bidens hawaiensis]|uniref:polyadenylate-binding protein-interacting protein 8-like n=1 Tax=Bidens hawaiensis TaxID=980011 RepID=UPI00404A0100